MIRKPVKSAASAVSAFPYRAHLSPVSSNVKTGPIAVSTSSRNTCPTDCPFKKTEEGVNGCYAEAYPLATVWDRVDAGTIGQTWEEFCKSVSRLARGSMFRINQAGDLPGDGALIDRAALDMLVDACADIRAFTYTHYSMAHRENVQAVAHANAYGVTVNLSANSFAHADMLADLNIAPVVTVAPSSMQRQSLHHKNKGYVKGGDNWTETTDEYKARISDLTTPAGRKVLICPATYLEGVSCASCKLCAMQASVRPIIAFPAHGTSARRIDIKLAA